MKSLSSRDIGILVVTGVLFLILGIAVAKLFFPTVVKETILDTELTLKLQKQNDSLQNVIVYREQDVVAKERRDKISDSILIMNNKNLKKDYEKLSNMDDSTFVVYLIARAKR